MPIHRIPGGVGGLLHDEDLDPVYLKKFTEAKNRQWAIIASTIDKFIYDKILERVNMASGHMGPVIEVITGSSFKADLHRDVYAALNTGLSLISQCQNPVLNDMPPRTMLKSQALEQDLRNLLSEFGHHGRQQRAKVRLSILWIDACLYRFLERTSSALAHRYR
jgi:hypothetical protein